MGISDQLVGGVQNAWYPYDIGIATLSVGRDIIVWMHDKKRTCRGRGRITIHNAGERVSQAGSCSCTTSDRSSLGNRSRKGCTCQDWHLCID
jgi:hypothetical protein